MKTFVQFYRYIFYQPVHFTMYLIFIVIARSVENLQPFFFRWLVAGVTTGNYQQVMNILVFFILALIVGTLAHSIGWYFGDRGVVKSAVRLQIDVMRKIHNLDFAYHTEKSSGKLISIMKRGEDAFFNMFDLVNAELYSVIIGLGFMLYAFASLGSKYVIVSVVAIVIAVICGIPILRRNLKYKNLVNEAEDKVTAARVDNLVNFDTVKYFAKEQFEQARLGQLLNTWENNIQTFLNTYRFMDLSIGNLSNIAIVVTIGLAVADLQAGKIRVADFVLIASFSASFFPRLMNVIMIFRNMVKRFSDLTAYFQVLGEHESVKDPSSPFRPERIEGGIKFDHVNFAYNTSNPVFTDFTLDIHPGESVALVGLSGSGKTTLVKLLMRMYDLTSGKILIDGANIASLTKSDLRSFIGIVPQDPLLFNHSLRYNISYANPELSEENIWTALRLAKLDSFVESLPQGLETQVGERGIKLSGGQRQRLAIARVLLEKAPIIVLDEATSSLDSESEGVVQSAFWDLVKDPAHPRTSIIIAHRLSTVMRTDRIVVLDKGKIVEVGTHHELSKKPKGLYHHLWKLQQHGFLQQV